MFIQAALLVWVEWIINSQVTRMLRMYNPVPRMLNGILLFSTFHEILVA